MSYEIAIAASIEKGFEHIEPAEMEKRLLAIGYEIEHSQTWIHKYNHPNPDLSANYKMIYPKDSDAVDVKALVELRKTCFTSSDGLIWDIGSF